MAGLDGELHHLIAKVILARAPHRRHRLHVQTTAHDALVRQAAWRQMHQLVARANRILIDIGGYMAGAVAHGAAGLRHGRPLPHCSPRAWQQAAYRYGLTGPG